MPEVVIVGAGLAGLTAAISCARAGHEVRVLEKYKQVGGAPDHHPSIDMTPMLPDRMGKFLGLDLKPPHVTPTASLRFIAYGKNHEVPGAPLFLQSVERGARESSLETHLFKVAQDCGVRFEFNWSLRSQKDVVELPPGSIIATGLHHEPYLALGIPRQDMYGFAGKGLCDGPPRGAAWFDPIIGEYSFFTNSNGVSFAMAFDRRPISRQSQERFIMLLKRNLDVELKGWHTFEAAVGVKQLDNPRLFSGRYILAGTLSGIQDPFFFFGVHASLLSGTIAAQAVDDKASAWDRFKKLSSVYKYTYIARRLFDPLPHAVRKPLLRTFVMLQTRSPQRYGRMVTKLIPGFVDVQKHA